MLLNYGRGRAGHNLIWTSFYKRIIFRLKPKLFLLTNWKVLSRNIWCQITLCCYNVKSITKIPLHNIWVLTFDCEGFQIELNYKVNGKLSLKRETALAWYLLYAPYFLKTSYNLLLSTLESLFMASNFCGNVNELLWPSHSWYYG